MAERRPTKAECYRQAYRYLARELVQLARERAMLAAKEQARLCGKGGKGHAG